MMDTILNLGLNDDALDRPRGRDRQRALRARLVPAPDPDVRRGRRRHRRPPLRAGARRAQARARRAAGRRSHSRRPRRPGRDVQGHLPAGDGRRLPAGPARAAPRARSSRSSSRGRTPRAQVYRRTYDDPRRHRHGRQRRADGLRQQGRPLGDRRLLHARPVDRRGGSLRRVPRERAGRGRRRRRPHAAADRGDARSGCPRRSTSCSRR